MGKINSHIRFILAIVLILIFSHCKKKLNNPAPPLPVACFNASSQFQKINEKINFSNCSENFDLAKWDFGDGSTSTETNPSYQYSKNGKYNVKLDVIKINQSQSISKNIIIANQVQIDFACLLKNFKGAVLSNSFTCVYTVVDDSGNEAYLFTANYTQVSNSAYVLKTDLSGLYFTKNQLMKYRFKINIMNNQTIIDTFYSDEINILESDNYMVKSTSINTCDIDYTITLRYI